MDDDDTTAADDDDTTAADDDDTTAADDDTTEAERWPGGTIEVRVVDPDGDPVEGVYAMMGGAHLEQWGLTDADGMTTVEVTDDGITDRWVNSGAVGYKSSAVDISEYEAPAGIVEVLIIPLPPTSADNPDYSFQPGGTSMSMDTSECGHCHKTIADDWSVSPHRAAGTNPRTWDVYVGGSDLAADACQTAGGWLADGQQPGVEGSVVERCYLGDGVLSFLHDDCGAPGEDGCDHPDQAASLDAFGSCADCHSPAIDETPAGSLDFARAFGVGHDEGITCDFCHKVRSAWAGPEPGRDGGLQLQRPSEPTTVFSQEFDPVNFGPYADVPIAIMKGSYNPDMRSADWCGSCHEYARGALRPDQLVDPVRWPTGLPINETATEYAASAYYGSDTTCHTCHMTVLEEESSTYDITPLGLTPGPDQGWLRESGEVHHHHFEYSLEEDSYGFVVSLTQVGYDIEATVTVTNQSAGHAMPTGEPMRQLLVLLTAVDEDGNTVAAIGGQAVPDVGGRLTQGVIDDDVVVDGDDLIFASAVPDGALVARFVRPSGLWDDYEPPGTPSFVGVTAEDKGLPIHEVLGERTIVASAGGTVTLDSAMSGLQAGDIVHLAGVDDRAGAAGWVYSKILVDEQGQRGVPHYRAIDMASDNRLGPGQTSTTTHLFPSLAPFEELTVTATLVFRAYAAPVAHGLGWDVGDEVVAESSDSIEIEDG